MALWAGDQSECFHQCIKPSDVGERQEKSSLPSPLLVSLNHMIGTPRAIKKNVDYFASPILNWIWTIPMVISRLSAFFRLELTARGLLEGFALTVFLYTFGFVFRSWLLALTEYIDDCCDWRSPGEWAWLYWLDVGDNWKLTFLLQRWRFVYFILHLMKFLFFIWGEGSDMPDAIARLTA